MVNLLVKKQYEKKILYYKEKNLLKRNIRKYVGSYFIVLGSKWLIILSLAFNSGSNKKKIKMTFLFTQNKTILNKSRLVLAYIRG